MNACALSNVIEDDVQCTEQEDIKHIWREEQQENNGRSVITETQSGLKLTWLSSEERGSGPLSCNCISTSLAIMQLNRRPLEVMQS